MMKITLHEIKVKDLVEGYLDSAEDGVRAYGGRLDVRPPYQREFVYGDDQQHAVIDTVMQDFPLNVMYWAVREDGTYEIIDGQQRTLSICKFYNREFSYMMRYYQNFQDDEQERFLNYKLQIYICSGTDSEKLKWFKTINIAGEELTEQELRNAVYAGPWLTDAKRYFSKSNCAAYNMGKNYLQGEVKRQAYLETAILWVSKGNIEVYMGNHQHDGNAVAMWNHFTNVINWVQALFPKYRKEMKGVGWGRIYDKYHENVYDPAALEQEVARMMQDSDVQRKKGIYTYVFSRDERELSIRAFDDNTRREVYERQSGVCPFCGEHFPIEKMHADHITPWSKGGRTVAENCQMLCADCNWNKSNK